MERRMSQAEAIRPTRSIRADLPKINEEGEPRL
jgi:hypothetical protein